MVRRSFASVTLALALTAPKLSDAQSAPAASPTSTSPLTIHGYLSQGFAKSDGEQLLGITKDGVADYRAAAIQFSYATSDNDRIVIQFDHRRLGVSPLTSHEGDVALDWAFYAHHFSNGIVAKVGKVLIPIGIYNELRDVGVLMPFYRAPYAFYGEGGWTTENIDGGSVARLFDMGHNWSLDATAYAGEFDYQETVQTPTTFDVFDTHARNATGSQLWLNTPVPGLRVGAGTLRFEVRGGVLQGPDEVSTYNAYHAGVDGTFEHFKVQAEARRATFNFGTWKAGYVLLGASPTSTIDVNVMGDFSGATLHDAHLPMVGAVDLNDDVAAGIDYHLTHMVVAKLEYHRAKSYSVERPIAVWLSPPPKTRYMILSLSTAF